MDWRHNQSKEETLYPVILAGPILLETPVPTVLVYSFVYTLGRHFIPWTFFTINDNGSGTVPTSTLYIVVLYVCPFTSLEGLLDYAVCVTKVMEINVN